VSVPFWFNQKYNSSMDNRKISVSMDCFVKKDGKYLILQRGPNKRILPNVCLAPGGHIERCEGLFEATHREILEETGLTITNLRIKATGMAYLTDIDEEFYLHIIVADYISGEVLIEANSESELFWATPEEISKLPTLKKELIELLPHIFGNSDNVLSYKAIYEKDNKLTSFEIEK